MPSDNPQRPPRPSVSASARRIGLSGLMLGWWGLFRNPAPTNSEQGPPEIVGPDAVYCPSHHPNLPDTQYCTTCGIAIDPNNPIQYQEPTPTLDQAYAGIATGLFSTKEPSSMPPAIVGPDAVYCARHHPNILGATMCSPCHLPLDTQQG
jgi:hypothetical protein